MNTDGIVMFGFANEYADEFADVLQTLNEKWITGNDSEDADIHFETHTIHNKKTPKDYTIVYPSGYPRTTREDPVTHRKIFLLPVNDKSTYIQKAEELADAKVDGSIYDGCLSKSDSGQDTRFTKWKRAMLEPPMYYVVSYKRDESTGEPLIITFFLADRDGFQATVLKRRIGELPKDEKKVDFSRYASPYNQPSGKVYYKEYAEDGKTEVDKEKEFDKWSLARNCFNKNTCVFKAEKYDVSGNLVPRETLTRGDKKLTVNEHGKSLDEGVDELSEAGYDGYSMSNNARVAYANDEKPLSKWSKDDILYCASRINKYKAMLLKKVSLEDLRRHLLTRTSWHHTSSYYNQTDFYSFDEDAYENVHESDIDRWVETHKQDVADRKKETPKIRKGRIDYLVWSGSRAHPKASEEHLDNVNIEERGSFYVITDDSGKEILRKKIGSNGTHVRYLRESMNRIDEANEKVHKDVTLSELKSLVDGIYSKLKSTGKPDDELIGGEYYGSAQLFHQRGNALEIITHYTTPGSYYEPSMTYGNCYAVKIGGAYPNSTYDDELGKLLAMFNYEVVSGWGLSDAVITSDGYEVSLIDRYGTGFSVYGINIMGKRSAKNERLGDARKQTAVKSNGVYSVMKGKWVKEPVADDIPELDKKAFETELTKWEDRYFDVSDNPTKESIDKFIEDIYDLRKAAIADDGEYSVGNLVFKQLRDFGYLDELKDRKREMVSKELSLESVGK